MRGKIWGGESKQELEQDFIEIKSSLIFAITWLVLIGSFRSYKNISKKLKLLKKINFIYILLITKIILFGNLLVADC